MSPTIKGMTIVVLVLPLIFGVWALITHEPVSGGVFLFLIALYGSVWVWCRPYRFVITHSYLEIVFPGWRRRIPVGDISCIRLINKETFCQEFGWAIRIGVGGLWGGFGWLWTGKRGLVEFYISQLNEFVLVERSQGKSLLITPENPNQLVEAVKIIATTQ
jgi:hypothetical protein